MQTRARELACLEFCRQRAPSQAQSDYELRLLLRDLWRIESETNCDLCKDGGRDGERRSCLRAQELNAAFLEARKPGGFWNVISFKSLDLWVFEYVTNTRSIRVL